MTRKLASRQKILLCACIFLLFGLCWRDDIRAAMVKHISAGREITKRDGISPARVFINGKKVCILVMEGRQYATIAATELRVPHFFDPNLQIDKRKVAEESIKGRPAIKYEAEIVGLGGMSYHGYLWELVDFPDLPARWEDLGQGVVVEWRDIAIKDLDDTIFKFRQTVG